MDPKDACSTSKATLVQRLPHRAMRNLCSGHTLLGLLLKSLTDDDDVCTIKVTNIDRQNSERYSASRLPDSRRFSFHFV